MQKRIMWHRRIAESADRPAILSLAKQQMDPILMEAWGQPVSPSDLFEIEDLTLYVIEDESGKMIGFYGVMPREDALHVQTLVLASHMQRQGLGTNIMSAIEQEAVRGGYQAIELCVQTTNPGALRLYERLGFVRQGYVFFSTLLLRKQLS